MNRGAALTGALLVTLATPATWPLALASFLLRGGIVLLTIPIIVLPTAVGLGRIVGPTVTSIALGSVPMSAIALSAAAVAGVSAWILVGGWLAAAMEAEGARLVAADEEFTAEAVSGGSPRVTDRGVALPATRILAARLIASIPLVLALAWGSIRVVAVTYDELTLPSDATSSIALRVLRGAPEVLIAVVVCWMAAEVVGALAARRIALRHDGIVAALLGAVADTVRHPLATATRFWLPTIVFLVILVPSALAAASASAAVGAVLGERADLPTVLVAVVLFVVLWIAGLLLAAVACAWRAAVWTVAEVRSEGTFGGSADSRPGDWRQDRTSASL